MKCNGMTSFKEFMITKKCIEITYQYTSSITTITMSRPKPEKTPIRIYNVLSENLCFMVNCSFLEGHLSLAFGCLKATVPLQNWDFCCYGNPMCSLYKSMLVLLVFVDSIWSSLSKRWYLGITYPNGFQVSPHTLLWPGILFSTG